MLWTCCGCAVYDLIILYKMTSANDMDDALLACSSMYVASAAVMYFSLHFNGHFLGEPGPAGAH